MKLTNTMLLDVYDRIRSTYWFVPLIMTVIAVLLAIGVSHADQTIPRTLFQEIWFILHINPANIHATLITFATTELAVIGVVFSITLVPLTIATSSYGAVLLRLFLRDLGTQVVLGTYCASIGYDLAILVIISNASFGSILPILSVTVALGLFVLDLAMLVYYFHHIASLLQSTTMIAYLGTELDRSINRSVLPGSPPAPGKTEPGASPGAGSVQGGIIPAPKTGYIRAVNYDDLMRIAHQKDRVFFICCKAGDFLNTGDPIVGVGPGGLDSSATREVQRSFYVGNYRTMLQDTRFGISLLVNIASRALSPAVNDPTTPVMVLDRLGVALGMVTEKEDSGRARYDEKGDLRLIIPAISFGDLSDGAFNLIRQYGRGNADVLVAMLDTISRIAPHVKTGDQQRVLLLHASLVKDEIPAGIPAEYDRQRVLASYENTVRALNALTVSPPSSKPAGL